VKRTATLILLLIALLIPRSVYSDEQVRQVQEELRKRNLYYGDIDGRTSSELGEAIARYQQRKGFAVTGAIDDPTLRSLGIAAPAPAIDATELPDVPVLRSDMGLRGSDFHFVNGQAAPAPTPAPTPDAPPKVAPPSVREQATDFIRRYFAACETANVNDELEFYGNEIDYYQHGKVAKTYVQQDLTTYDERWPTRKYVVDDKIRISERGDKIIARCRVSFSVATIAELRKANGKTDQTFMLGRRPDGSLEIQSIKEVRVRPPSSKSRSKSKKPVPLLQRAGNTVKKLFDSKGKPRRYQDQRP
jgi:hypothetical protein